MDDKEPIVSSQPGEYQPTQPGGYQQTHPGEYQQTQPGGYQQTHPGEYQQTQPGGYQATQPGYQQANVVTVQPQFGTAPGKMLIPMTGNRDWSSGLCDCTQDATNCVLVAFCTPCMQCQVASRMGEAVCVPVCVPGGMIALRQRLRTLGGIQGTLCNDCLMFHFCGYCALCQMKREMDVMGIV